MKTAWYLFGTAFAIIVATDILLPRKAYAEAECEIARKAMEQASQIRKLRIKKAVPCLVRSREEVKKFILNTIDTKIPAQKLRMEEVTYKALGLIPENFAYAQGMVDLYLSQLGGYYDPEKKHFVMAGWMPTMMQPTIAAHELTHALQDQYYDLNKFIDPKSENSDAQLAHSALVEGDATAVMMDYMRGLMGQPGIERDGDVNSFMMQNVLGMSLTAGTGNVPQSLQMLLLFPYTSGLRFAHALLRKGSYAEIDRAFRRPPSSTEEILHPEKYLRNSHDYITFDSTEFTSELPQGAKIVHQDTIGEFMISALLGMFVGDKLKAADAAAGWGGDLVVIAEEGEGRYFVIWKSNWDTDADAQQFGDAISSAYSARFQIKEPNLFARRAALPGGKSCKIERSGARVTVAMEWR